MKSADTTNNTNTIPYVVYLRLSIYHGLLTVSDVFLSNPVCSSTQRNTNSDYVLEFAQVRSKQKICVEKLLSKIIYKILNSHDKFEHMLILSHIPLSST